MDKRRSADHEQEICTEFIEAQKVTHFKLIPSDAEETNLSLIILKDHHTILTALFNTVGLVTEKKLSKLMQDFCQQQDVTKMLEFAVKFNSFFNYTAHWIEVYTWIRDDDNEQKKLCGCLCC